MAQSITLTSYLIYNLQDKFIDTNGTSIAAHTPNQQPNGLATSGWSQTAANSFYIQNNSVQPNRLLDTDLAIIDSGMNEFTLRCTITPYFTTSPFVEAYGCLVFRYKDSANFWYIQPNGNDQTVDLYNVVAGAYTLIAACKTSVTSGLPIACRVDCWQNNITLWVNGVEIVTYVSSNFATSTIVGLRCGAHGSPSSRQTWSNLTLQPFQGVKLNWPLFKKFTSNPIVPQGTGSAWDATDVNDPVVQFDPVNNRFVLMYSGYYNGGSAPGTKVQNLGLAYAKPGQLFAGNWVKEPTNPVMVSNGGDGIYAFNGGFCKKGSTWYQLYCTNNAGSIALATSTDLKTWTRQGTVFNTGGTGKWDSNGVFDPYVRLREDGITFEMWYAGADISNNRGLGYATSTNATTWTRNATNPVFRPPSFASYSPTLGEPSVFVPTGQEGVEMLVSHDTATPAAGNNRFISQALTIDGGATWHLRIAASAKGSGWESQQNFDSHMFKSGNKMYLAYGGANIAGAALNLNIQAGMAVANWPFSSFIG